MELSSPITGATQDLFTSPTYTLSSDTALESNQKAYIVSAVGGTQSGVDAHSVGNPFQVVIQRPKNVKLPTAAVLEAVGFQGNAQVNEHKLITRKSATINSLGGSARILVETRFVVPVGAVETSPEEIQAALSAHIGALNQDATDWWDIISSGSL